VNKEERRFRIQVLELAGAVGIYRAETGRHLFPALKIHFYSNTISVTPKRAYLYSFIGEVHGEKANYTIYKDFIVLSVETSSQFG